MIQQAYVYPQQFEDVHSLSQNYQSRLNKSKNMSVSVKTIEQFNKHDFASVFANSEEALDAELLMINGVRSKDIDLIRQLMARRGEAFFTSSRFSKLTNKLPISIKPFSRKSYHKSGKTPASYVKIEQHLSRIFGCKRLAQRLSFFPKTDQHDSFVGSSLFHRIFNETDDRFLIICIALFIDDFNLYNKAQSKSGTGIYMKILNMDQSTADEDDSICPLSVTLAGEYSHSELLDHFLNSMMEGEEGFRFYNAYMESWLNIRLHFTFIVADMKERNNLCHVVQPGSVRGCSVCTRQTKTFHLTWEEFRNNERDMRSEKRSLAHYLRTRDKQSRGELNSLLGYKDEGSNVFIDRFMNVYHIVQTDLFHAEVCRSGNFRRHFKFIRLGLDDASHELLDMRLQLMCNLTLSAKRDWHGQDWDLVAKRAPLIFKDLVDHRDYLCMVNHSIYYSLLRCHMVNQQTIALVRYHFSLYVRQFRDLYFDTNLTYPNLHAIEHLIDEVEVNMMSPSLIWTQPYERYHQKFRYLLQRKKDIYWCFKRLVQTIDLSSSVDDEDEDCLLSVFASQKCKNTNIRYMKFRISGEKESVGSHLYHKVNHVHFTKHRKLKKGDYVSKDNRLGIVEDLLIGSCIVVSVLEYNVVHFVPGSLIGEQKSNTKWILNTTKPAAVVRDETGQLWWSRLE